MLLNARTATDSNVEREYNIERYSRLHFVVSVSSIMEKCWAILYLLNELDLRGVKECEQNIVVCIGIGRKRRGGGLI